MTVENDVFSLDFSDMSPTLSKLYSSSLSIPELQRMDWLLCSVIGMPISDFSALSVSEQLVIYEQNMPRVLAAIIYGSTASYDPAFLSFFSSYSKFTFTSEHLESCSCYSDVVRYFSEIESKRDLVKLHGNSYVSSGLPIDYSIYYNNSKSYLKSAYRNASNYLNSSSLLSGRRICPHLYNELYNTFRQFNHTYDLSLPKVSVVVRSILDYQVSLYYSIIHSQSSGSHETIVDKFGNVSVKVSDNEYYRMKLNEKIVDAIRVLDQMIEGSKSVNLTLNVSAIPIEDILSGFRDEVSRKYASEQSEDTND